MSGREKTKEQLISEVKAHITANPDSIFIQDGKGMYTGVYANPELLFVPAEEIVGRYCIDVLPEHVTKKILGAIAEVKNDRQMVEFEYQLEVPAGSKYFSARLVRSGVDSFMSIIREVTEQKKAEDALKESESKYRSVVDALDEGVLFQLADGSIQACNKSAERILGLSAEKLLGRSSTYPGWKPVHEDGTPFPTETHPFALVMKTGEQVSNVIMGIPHPSGETKWISVSCCPIVRGAEELPYAVVSSFTDITERKELEIQLRQSQKMEAIGVLTAGIAHEFNNLLSPILGFTEMLIRGKSKGDPDLKGLEYVQNAGNRAKSLIQQMLAYGRKSFSVRKPMQLEDVVKSAIQLTEGTIPSNISMQRDFQPNLPLIWGVSNEIHQVFLNMFLNASDAMPEGGKLLIRTQKHGFRQFFSTTGQSREGSFVSVSVQDSGVGMDQATLDRVFDPFFTSKGVGIGTGLGLSVVQGIVEQHQGHIEVETEVGKGSTFHVYFPVFQGELKSSVLDIESIARGNERILLIDDEPMVLEIEKVMLEKLGYQVTDFLDCVAAVNQFADHPQSYELVITDYGMQVMNGKQVANKIKEFRTDIPIILLTGYEDLVRPEEVGVIGIDELMMKPFELEHLSITVRKVLDSATKVL